MCSLKHGLVIGLQKALMMFIELASDDKMLQRSQKYEHFQWRSQELYGGGGGGGGGFPAGLMGAGRGYAPSKSS